MSEQCLDTLRCDPADLRQAMSIHTRKITDSCRDKDCVEDLRVYLTTSSQATLNSATGAKVRCIQLLYTALEVEPVAFDNHHYCIEMTFYYRILGDASTDTGRFTPITGLSLFTKRAVLCGEDSCAHIFSSDQQMGQADSFTGTSAGLPTAVVEVLDPMVLSSKLLEADPQDQTVVQIPDFIADMFDEPLVVTSEGRRLMVTLGQFSILRLERDAQLVIPVLNYAIPLRECCDSADGCMEDPCDLFSRIPFPTNQFTPTGCDSHCACSNG